MISRWSKKLYVTVVALVAAFTLATSVDIANAQTVPNGCFLTSYQRGCKRCGFLWLKQYWWQQSSWACPGGVTGTTYESGPCAGCPF